MGIPSDKLSDTEDVFFDYDLEEVMFRWDFQKKKIFRKFYGEVESALPIDDANRLLTDAWRFGEKISAADYKRGKPKLY